MKEKRYTYEDSAAYMPRFLFGQIRDRKRILNLYLLIFLTVSHIAEGGQIEYNKLNEYENEWLYI